MLKEIYYKLAALFFRPQVKHLGQGCKLRMNGRVLGGQYVHLADGVGLEKGFVLAVYPSFGGKDNPVKDGGVKGIWLGENGSYNRNLTIYCADTVRIGRDVLFGSNVLVSDNEHGTDPEGERPYRDQRLRATPVEIGDGCWVAEDVKILRGTTIGEKCIVAAGAVVKGKFPPRCVIAGVPAKVIRTWDPETKQWVRPKA